MTLKTPRSQGGSPAGAEEGGEVRGGWREKRSAIEVDDGVRGAKSEIMVEHRRSHECSVEEFSESVSEIAGWYRRHRHRLSFKTIIEWLRFAGSLK